MSEIHMPDSGTLVEIYRKMTLIKQNDERFRSALRTGKLAIPYYSPRGQEVIPSAVSVNLRADDYICTIYRGVHDMLAKGVPPKQLWAEFAGKATGTCKGKGGPMHITHPESGVMVTTGIVGSSMPIANGLALAAQVRGEDKVSVAYFGDGATNIGAFHESLNMASIWKLPVIFVCQNNGYAEHTKFRKGTAVRNISHRAMAYDMPGETVDGNDPIAMWNVARNAIERARAGEGPTLIEARTFRFFGHVFGDVDGYMDEGEKALAIARDPVPLFREWLIQQKHTSEDSLRSMEEAIEREIDEALELALASSPPDLEELALDVYAEKVIS